MAMLTLLQQRMRHPEITVHGFRSNFREWAAKRTNFPGEVAEMALAHVGDDKFEAAYRAGRFVAEAAAADGGVGVFQRCEMS
jgi:hypothetical protein